MKETALNNRKIMTGLIALTLCAIWIQSALGSDRSEAESMWLFGRVYGILRFLVGEERATVHLLRKLAHFTEFFILGTEGMALRRSYRRRDVCSFITVFLLCNFAAFLDETIQLFSGRGPSVTDIWIDTSGAFSGMMFFLVFAEIRDALIRKKGRKQ